MNIIKTKTNKLSEYIRKTVAVCFVLSVLFAFSFPHRYAIAKSGMTLELSASSDTVDVNEDFYVVATLKAGTDTSVVNLGALRIPGLENFEQYGVSNNTQFQSINGVSVIETKSVHHLTALKSGTYTIGPVAVSTGLSGSDKILSNTITITVNDGDGLLGGLLKKDNEKKFTNNKDTITDVIDQNVYESANDNIEEKGKVRGNDIFTDKRIVFWLFIIIPVFVLLYLLLKKDSEKFKKQISDLSVEIKNTVLNIDDKIVEEDGDYKKSVSFNLKKEVDDLFKINDKSFYAIVVSLLATYLSIVSDNSKVADYNLKTLRQNLEQYGLSEEDKEIINRVLRECDVGKYAPDNSDTHKKIITQLQKLSEYKK